MPSNILCEDSCTSQLNCTTGRGWVVLQYGGEWGRGGGEVGWGGVVHTMIRWPSVTIALRELW